MAGSFRFCTFGPRCAIGAVMFVLSPNMASAGLTVLHTFCGTGHSCSTDGARPDGLVRDSNGNLFGVAALEDSYGKVYEISSSGSYSVVYSFCQLTSCADGSHPQGTLVLDTSGNLYGVTNVGGGTGCGGSGCGTIFEVSPGTGGSWTLKTLHVFCQGSCADGANPMAGLTYIGAGSGSLYDGTSPLYGTTTNGGSSSEGTAFKLSSPSSTAPVTGIYSFCALSGCSDGSMPPNPLIADASGNFYGTTQAGGNSTDTGVVFELSPPVGSGTGYTETVLHDFCTTVVMSVCTDGYGPNGPLIMDTQGRLVGTANSGGANNHGDVFRVVPNGTSSTFSVRYSFCPVQSGSCPDGDLPNGGLSMDASGDFYGTAAGGLYGGIPGDGVIFKLHGTSESVLFDFCSSGPPCDAQLPISGVILDGSGDLFGTTAFGGNSSSGGAVFEWAP